VTWSELARALEGHCISKEFFIITSKQPVARDMFIRAANN